jgi:uncharacterized protein (DUF2147 family)
MIRTFIATALAAFIIASPASAQAADIGSVAGDWRNAKNTVHIRAYPCGSKVCGVVVWAAPKAEADARRGGTTQLKGTQVFREFVPEGGGSWKGKVYVPDLARTFSGKLRVTADDKLVGKGCVLGGLICKSTTWLRVS